MRTTPAAMAAKAVGSASPSKAQTTAEALARVVAVHALWRTSVRKSLMR